LSKEKSSVFFITQIPVSRLNEAFHNTFQHEGEKLGSKKRIVSTDYLKDIFTR
jgi:hypothetical protein